MHRRRLQKLRKQAEALAEDKRRREAMKAPCPECGHSLTDQQGHRHYRVIDFGEDPCPACVQRIERYGDLGSTVFIEMVPTEDDPGYDPAQDRAISLAFLQECSVLYGMTEDDLRQRYSGHYPDIEGLLANLTEDDGPEAA